MIAVIFEVIPHQQHFQTYLNIAAALKAELDQIEGFISIERFQSITNPEKILSLSFWKDEAGIQEWRTREMHRDAQAQGRNHIFSDYRLRIAGVVRDYGMFNREQAPPDSIAFHTR